MGVKNIIIGTRNSALALWQSNYVKALLTKVYPDIEISLKEITTQGDITQKTNVAIPLVGGKGLFTAELEAALRDETIDIAVHSLKDLPTEMEPIFTVAAITERDSPFDSLVSKKGLTLDKLPACAVVGTSSPRREAQLKRLRPDLDIRSVRGNIDTRVMKLMAPESQFDAIVLAESGLNRLGHQKYITEVLSAPRMLPAPGQGALAVQCATKRTEIIEMLKKIDHLPTRISVSTERAFLHTLQGGCSTPVATFAELQNDKMVFHARCLSFDGVNCIETERSVTNVKTVEAGIKIGQDAAQEALECGFKALVCKKAC